MLATPPSPSPRAMSETPMSTSPSESGQPPAKPASRWEDFIDIFYAPSEVFARDRKSVV